MNRHKILAISLFVSLLVAVVVLNCSESTGPEEADEAEPTFTPESGPPGTLVRIAGLNLSGVPADVTVDPVCVDKRMQWSQAKNIWYNAQIRTLLYMPVRLLGKPVRDRRARKAHAG